MQKDLSFLTVVSIIMPLKYIKKFATAYGTKDPYTRFREPFDAAFFVEIASGSVIVNPQNSFKTKIVY